MRKFIVPIFLILFVAQSSLLYATNPISPNWNEPVELIENKTSKKNSIFKKAKQFLQKKIAKMSAAVNLKNLGLASLIIGLTSLIALFLGLWVAPWMFILAFVLAIIGDIVSLIALRRANQDMESNRKVRTMAWIGLITSLLTGLLPLALFISLLLIGF